MNAVGKIVAAPASLSDGRMAWDRAERWYRSLEEARNAAMPEAIFTAADHALCAAMKHLIEDIASPDERALILKMELMRDLLADAVPSEWWDALEEDVARLVGLFRTSADPSDLDRLIADYGATGKALSAGSAAAGGLPNGHDLATSYMAAVTALDAYEPRSPDEFVRALAARFDDGTFPTDDGVMAIIASAKRLAAEGC